MKAITIAVLVGIMVLVTGVAQATVFSTTQSPMTKNNYYTWGINWTLPSGDYITAASLSISGLRSASDPGGPILFGQLINTATVGWGTQSDSPSNNLTNDFTVGVQLFSQPLSSTALSFTYPFTAGNITTLTSYLSDGNFAIGLDPDGDGNHTNTGIQLTIETASATPIPEPASMALVGLGLAGLLARRARGKRNRL